MIPVGTKVTSNHELALDRYEARLRQEVLLSGVARAAEVMYGEVRLNASRGGPSAPDVRTGALLNAIYRAYIPERSTGAQKTYFVSWRRADAPHGQLLEFGTSKMPAQPFLRPSLSRLPDALRAGIARMKERIRE